LKFEELKRKLKEIVKNCYFVYGSDLFLKQKAIDLIIEASVESAEELNVLTFSTDNLDAGKVIDACNTMPFFSNKKVVIIKEYEKKLNDTFIKKLEEYLKSPNETTCLVLISEDESTYFEPLKKYSEIVDCNPLSNALLEKIIDTEVSKKNKTIDYIAKKLLIEYCSGNLSRINTELSKLLFLDNSNIITVEMVKENVTKDLEFEVYELTNALSEKNTKDAYIMVKHLLDSKNTPSSIFALIYRHFRRLFYIAINNGTNIKELSEKLGVKEFAIKKSGELVKNFGITKLKEINELCLELDYKTKTGKYNAEDAIYYFVMTILNT